jgi:hypothetical protein
MSNNKKAYDAHELVGKHPSKFTLLLKHMQHLKIYWKIINWPTHLLNFLRLLVIFSSSPVPPELHSDCGQSFV